MLEINAIDPLLLEQKISDLLDSFYNKRSLSLNNLKLINTLKRKNPYLYRAVGVNDASDISEIMTILVMFQSASLGTSRISIQVCYVFTTRDTFAFGDKGYLGKKIFEELIAGGLKLSTRTPKILPKVLAVIYEK